MLSGAVMPGQVAMVDMVPRMKPARHPVSIVPTLSTMAADSPRLCDELWLGLVERVLG